MARKTKPSFVLTLPLATQPADERAWSITLDAARNIGNAVLSEGLRRLDLMREGKAYKAARRMPRGAPRSPERKARAQEFKRLFEAFGVTGHSLQRFAQQCRNACWIKDHLPGHACQTAANRAFNAILQHAFGKRGRPFFKRRFQYNSVEGKEAKSTLIWRDGAIRFAGRSVPAILDPRDTYQAEALRAPTKYSRIVRRAVRGRERWSLQLVQEGRPPLRRETKRGVVALDIGPSTVAAVSGTEAIFEQFCPSVVQPWKELRRIERVMDRSKRANNPDCFDEKGRWKKGARMRVRSKRYQALACKRRERERRLAAERRRAHGELANRIAGQGTTVKTEKLSYRSFQKNFGKSAKVRAPGMFVGILRNKLAAAGGELIEFPTRTTKLSQFCHVGGTYTKKPLKQRYHQFPDGSRVGRDVYSAFLARFVSGDRLVASHVVEAWPGAESLLRAATPDGIQTVSGQAFALPHALRRVGTVRPKNGAGSICEAGNAVAAHAVRVPESGAAGSEAPPFTDGS